MKLPKARTENLVVRNTGSETLVYDIAANRAFCLNEIAGIVWKRCVGDSNSKEIAKTLDLDVAVVDYAILRLGNSDLLEEKVETKRSAGLPFRRKFLIDAAALSSVAIPVITTVVAPRAVVAQSCLAGQFVPGTSTPDTVQLSAFDCSSHCAVAIPSLFSPCCFGGAKRDVFGTGSPAVCQCLGVECHAT